ncbi:N-6 DNA methylase [Mesorhizobium loti]|nr:N-6 DNA methylase [Mesorhizobium loti]
MSRALINEYRGDLDRLRAVSGSRRESVLREAFKDLLKRWGRASDLQFVSEHDIVTRQKNRIYLDGALLHALRVPFGYWEAKDADDDLDAEIVAKSRKGYPRDNIIYSDDHTAILIQDGLEVARAPMDGTEALYDLLITFFAHERQEIADFNKAVKQFGQDLPAVLTALRELIADKRKASKNFVKAEKAFLKHAQDAINPAVNESDVQEMLIQHILTEDIFAKVFDNPDFHRQNNVASELYKLEEKLFGYGEKQRLLRALQPYYAGIAQTAAVIQSHSEKQGFLKGLYENFYKVYNAKASDRLGVVYTPGEIVRFMIRSADLLCERHFGKNLIDKGVEILDPATGTGTFIVELLEHFRGDHAKMRHKYKEELHANEVAILPYYVANLNIEATFQAITGQFAEFENLCFVDTLDNVDALGIHAGHQFDLLGTLSDENIERIKRQNRRKISVIIGNPPYNANQQNESDNNKNRTYAHIDRRIKETYIKASTAQKTKLYDMYARFYRWASDRLGDDGVLAFVTNRSFIESRTFDGFRKVVAKDFNEMWLIDLGGDVRENPKLSGTRHNIFGIQTGVAIAFLIRKKDARSFSLKYARRPEEEIAEDKLAWLGGAKIETLHFTTVKPDAAGNWIQVGGNEFTDFLPVADKATKTKQSATRDKAIFRLYSLGIVTARDDWVYDQSRANLVAKITHLRENYEAAIGDLTPFSSTDSAEPRFGSQIKWTRLLKSLARSRKMLAEIPLRPAAYRPFTSRWLAYSPQVNEVHYLNEQIFPVSIEAKNLSITFTGPDSQKPWLALAVNQVPDLHFVGSAAGTMELPRYRYSKSGERIDNITDWGFNKFVAHYGRKGITKDAIFRYVYAVLHDPVYRETYELNLKRTFPRIPFYPDFAKWAAWGETLMTMHVGYEDVVPWPAKRIDTPSTRAAGTHPKPLLKSDSAAGVIHVDADTQITGIPSEAWGYRLGNRSAIDWVLDQHKEKKPRDSMIAKKFNTYSFADRKESMIALLSKVVRVSVDTVAITEAMKAAQRSA